MRKILVPYGNSGDVASATLTLPKYVSAILNIINRINQTTRPANVGQMTALVQEFIDAGGEKSLAKWKEFYDGRHPGIADKAAEKNAAEAVQFNIKREDAVAWTKNLIYEKTYQGLIAQESIGNSIAAEEGRTFRRSSREEEARGIDGWLDGEPVSIKPTSYKGTIPSHYECIEVRIIFYSKTKEGFEVKF